MLSVCRQYISDIHFAEDAMVQGFVKVFNKLDQFRHEGSFEGWIRRIMVREAISHLRKKQFMVFDEEMLVGREPQVAARSESDLQAAHIQSLIDDLPEGYKMVFVLHVVEGYKHAEIADLLDISENTSRSQLFKARQMLQDQLKPYKNQGYATHRMG